MTVSDASFTGDYSGAITTTSGTAPSTGVYPRSPDPLAHLTPPSTAGCHFIDAEYDEPVVFLSSGIYCGTFTVKNATHAFLAPGLYTFKGGPMKIEDDSVLEGVGVTLYFTDGGYSYEPFHFSSSARALLSAPTDPMDPYFGILIWVDPTRATPVTNTGSRAVA